MSSTLVIGRTGLAGYLRAELAVLRDTSHAPCNDEIALLEYRLALVESATSELGAMVAFDLV